MSVGRLSIRTRLTLAIVAITAILSTLAVIAGSASFERQIRERAIEQRLDEVAEVTFEDLLFDDLDALKGLDPDQVFEITGIEIVGDDLDGFFGTASTEKLVEEARFVLFELARLGLADEVFEQFGDDRLLRVLLANGQVASFEPNLAVVDITGLDEVDGVVVPESELLELVAVSFELFDTDPDQVERDLDYVVAELDQLRIGLLVDITDELAALDGIRASLWLAAAGLVVLSGAATWLLTGRALRPVGSITERVDAITSGTLDGRVPEPAGDDEIGVLARTMNRMLGRLERADLQRRQFVSDASHELRTPVAVLRSEAEVASRAPATTTVEGFADVVLGETGRLERLVEDLLALARADENRWGRGDDDRNRDGSDVDVDEVVLSEAARTRRLPVDRRQVSAGRVRGRASDLARAVGHLLDNAARHAETSVAVGVRTEGDRVRVWVDDDGAGIAESDRDRIFQRFTRLDEARDRDRGGSGLGLAVVTETVRGLGGTVTVESSPLGGARFLLDLPAA